MDSLIKSLEAKITDLIGQLQAAKTEIEQLKQSPETQSTKRLSAPCDSTLDLLSSMGMKRSTEEQLQLYIEDSLGLLSPNPSSEAMPSENTNHLDLFCHDLEDQIIEDTTHTKDSPMTTEQQVMTHADDLETAATEVESTQATSLQSDAPEKTALSAEEKKRKKNQQNNRRLIKLLEERYPKAFDWNNPRPLKVGIDKDMVLDDDFNASKQKRAMAAYTRSDRYKKSLLSGQPRIDLEGNAVSSEPALPNAKKPVDAPAPKKPFNKAKQRPQGKRTHQNKPKPQTTKPATEKAQPKVDPQFENLSPAERMQAKLDLLLNKK